MEALSRIYGWTPQQIREQRAEDIDQYVEILNEKNSMARFNALKNKT